MLSELVPILRKQGFLPMRKLITSMGECLIDFLPLQKEGQTTDFRMSAAGSHLNVAVGVARLGQAAAFSSKIADDYFGRYLYAYIEKNGIDTRFIKRVPGLSTLAFVAMENGQPDFNFYGNGTADALMTLEDVPDALFEETSILHIGCISLLRGTTPETIRHTFEQLKNKALLSLDPNLRPLLVQDEPKYRTLLQHLIGLTDVLKMSDADLAWLMPGISVETALHHLIQKGPALVVITRGSEGAIALRHGTSTPIQVPVFSVNVADTIGAGDTFCAGLLSRLADNDILTRTALRELNEEELSDILRFATAAAALNCTHEGANPPDRTEVEYFLTRN